MAKINCEGLSAKEWFGAAGYSVLAEMTVAERKTHTGISEAYGRLKKAWLAGEDPTEWRAMGEREPLCKAAS